MQKKEKVSDLEETVCPTYQHWLMDIRNENSGAIGKTQIAVIYTLYLSPLNHCPSPAERNISSDRLSGLSQLYDYPTSSLGYPTG